MRQSFSGLLTSAWTNLVLVLLAVNVVFAQDDPKTLPDTAASTIDYVRDIRPLFKSRCYSCHDAAKQRGGFRLDLKSSALKGGENYAPAIRPGHSAESPLIRFVAGLEDGMLMPPEGDRLTPQQIDLLRAWIDQGAKWPDDVAETAVVDHWSFQPIRRPKTPDVSSESASWSRNPIDLFVAGKLNEAAPSDSGQHASPEADRVTLIRRLCFDLLGLPPTAEDVETFVADSNPDAYERLIDRLLASPHFGERWARHWLDVVRFAESDGFETNQPRPNAWPYRDYVIRAFNEDKPYEQFLTEQLAGDRLGVDEATGFVVGGAVDRVKSPDPGLTAQQRADELHDMVSTTGSAFLGLTVGCARCHNHKFDPISQADYYALKAVFAGVQHGERPLKALESEQRERQRSQLKSELASLENSLRSFEPLAWVVARNSELPRENRPSTTLLLDDDSADSTLPSIPTVTQLVPRLGLQPHNPGTGRGHASDPGDARRFPNLGRNYSYWNDVASKDVFTWNPRVNGRYHVWVSWGCGWQTHAADARYILDRDGNLATRDDQQEIARVDQRRFADGTGGNEQQPLWSGFLDVGSYAFTPATRLILRGGQTDAYVSADLLCLQETQDLPVDSASTEGAAANRGSQPTLPSLRASVYRKANTEHFVPITARFVRFVVEQTNNGSQPCLDELEVFTTGATAQNVARNAIAKSSSNLPGYEIHQLKHVNDGRYGNSASWISNEAGRGWVLLAFPQPVEIDRVVWSRDRLEEGQFSDRIATKYRIEAGLTPESMVIVATSDDRIPIERNLTALPTRTGLNEREQQEANQLSQRQAVVIGLLRELPNTQQVYAGRMGTPEPTFRFHRGDPMQPREPIVPAGLSAFGTEVKLPMDASDSTRRMTLAEWMIEPGHPLTARVLVNRLWHFHLGQGLVTTPSDFGRNGARPSHPELLDWLASEVFRQRTADAGAGPSITSQASSPKRLHRLIVTSATYRQCSAARPDWMQRDAGSRLLWRYPPRRLEAEPLRDAILSVCGNLDDRMGGPGFDLFEPNTNYVKVYNSRREFGPAEWRRMVYQSKPRMQLDDTFGSFDCPDAGQIAPKRTSSITALQALNLLNSGFIIQQSSRLADRLQRDAGPETAAQVRRAFQLAFQREPSPDEQSLSVQLIQQHGLSAFCRAILNSNEFLFVF